MSNNLPDGCTLDDIDPRPGGYDDPAKSGCCEDCGNPPGQCICSWNNGGDDCYE